MDEVLLRRLLGAFVLLALAFGLASLLPDRDRNRQGGSNAVTYDLRTGKPLDATAPKPPPPAPQASVTEPAPQAPPPKPNPPVVLKESPKESPIVAKETAKPPPKQVA